MLRLRPSELTLTSDDVEETFRRMARKQTLKASRHASSQPPTQLGRPFLRQGTQRAVRDAVTTLGDIPILRPQPQQALFSSANDDIEDDSDHSTIPLQRVDSGSGSVLPTQNNPTASAPAPAPVLPHVSGSPLSRSLHLPYRVARDRLDVSTQPDQAEHQVSGRHLSPTPSPRRPTGDTNAVVSPDETSRSPLGLRGGGKSNREGKGTSRQEPRHDAPSSRQELGDDSSSEGEHDWMSRNTDPNNPPTLYLRGFWTDPVTHPKGPAYDFQEMDPNYMRPRTEPRRQTRRSILPTRSLSSGGAPTQRAPTYNPGATFSGLAYNALSESAFTHPPSTHNACSSLNPRAPSYSLSAASGLPNLPDFSNLQNDYRPPYDRSYVPPSGPFSNPRGLQPPQYDYENSTAVPHYGLTYASPFAAPSGSSYSEPRGPQSTGQQESDYNQPSQYNRTLSSLPGAQNLHYPSQPPEPQPTMAFGQQPHMNMGLAGQQGVSPLPSMPYTRQSTPNRHGSWSGRALDAATAAAQDLPSPLDTYSNFYQQQAQSQSVRHVMPTQPPIHQYPTAHLGSRSLQHSFTPVQPPFQQHPMQPPIQQWPTANLANHPSGHSPTPGQNPFQRHLTPNSGNHNQPRNSGGRRSTPDEPQTRLPSDDVRTTSSSRPYDRPRPGMRGGSAGEAVQASRRSAQVTRAEQRSSENMPVRPAAQSLGPSRNSQVQIHRAAFERLHNARLQNIMREPSPQATESPLQDPARLGLPRLTEPHDASNQSQTQGSQSRPPSSIERIRQRMQQNSSSPLPLEARSSPADVAVQIDAPGALPGVSASSDPRVHGRYVPNRSYTRTRRRATPAAPSLAIHPTRHLPSTALALDHANAITSVRSPLTRALTLARQHRRVPPRQLEQENVGVEAAVMREEMDAVLARYGVEEQRNETMDETPPRVGRVERRMADV